MNRGSLLRRLDAGIRTATDDTLADGLRCERAAYLARMGRFDLARETLDGVQARLAADRSPSPPVGARIRLHLAEALYARHLDLGAAAQGRLERAHALARAGGRRSLQALAAAWLAQLAADALDGTATVRHAAEALALAAPSEHATLARATLVVAQAWQATGRFDRARPWYDQARRHAVRIADAATLGEAMATLAWGRLDDLERVRVMRHGAGHDDSVAPAGAGAANPGASAADGDAFDALRLAVESSVSFDGRIGRSSLPWRSGLLQARTASLGGRPGDALALYDAHLDGASAAGLGKEDAPHRADRALCLLRLGRRDEALTVAADAAERLSARGADGGEAAAHGALAELYDAAGDTVSAARHRDHAARAWRLEAERRAGLARALDDASLGRPPA